MLADEFRGSCAQVPNRLRSDNRSPERSTVRRPAADDETNRFDIRFDADVDRSVPRRRRVLPWPARPLRRTERRPDASSAADIRPERLRFPPPVYLRRAGAPVYGLGADGGGTVSSTGLDAGAVG